MALTHCNHLPVLLVLHVVMHNLLEPGTRTKAYLGGYPWKSPWVFPFP
jgi:hypothetical protein